MTSHAAANLAPFYRFFETYGSERLNGLNESHFQGLSDAEREEAWRFLEDGFEKSEERIAGLYKLDARRAVALFKKALQLHVEPSPYAASRESQEMCRLLLLRFVNSVEPDRKYVDAMTQFANSEFKNVRAQFAMSVPVSHVTPEAVDALKGMIFTETERIPLASAITKYMVIHGMDFDMEDPMYNSIYMALRSDDPKAKIAAFKSLEDNQSPGYA